MCRPAYYTIAYEINPWMNLRRQATRAVAARQWQALHRLLTTKLNASVSLLRPEPRLPDLVFTANAGLVAGRTLIRSHFRHPERQGEEPIIDAYFRQLRYRVVTLPRGYNFEGEGDALFVGDTLFLGFRFRSDAKAHEQLARILGCRVLPLELADRRFYHLDTCFCPLDHESALWYPGAFDRYGRKVIEAYVRNPIPVSDQDALQFACNAIVIGRSMIVHTGMSAGLRRQLDRRGFHVYETDLSEFLRAGGSAKCLVLRLHDAQAAMPPSPRLLQRSG